MGIGAPFTFKFFKKLKSHTFIFLKNYRVKYINRYIQKSVYKKIPLKIYYIMRDIIFCVITNSSKIVVR
jgi:hypothetical protein